MKSLRSGVWEEELVEKDTGLGKGQISGDGAEESVLTRACFLLEPGMEPKTTKSYHSSAVCEAHWQCPITL